MTQSQFYHINPAWLTKNNVSVSGPSKINIYGSKSGMLSSTEDIQMGFLKPIPAFYQMNSTSSWEILFWGDAPHSISQKGLWAQETNRYSDTTFYYVQIDASQPQSIEEVNPPSGIGTPLPFAYAIKHYEPETYNLLQSGQTWLGDSFYGSSNKFLQYTLADYAEGKPAYLEAKFYASSINAISFNLPSLGKTINLTPISGGRYDTKASSQILKTWVTPNLTAKNWNLAIQFQSTGGTGYIDYVRLVYPRTLDAKNTSPLYLLPNSSDSTMHIAFSNLTSQQQIWINNGGEKWSKLVENKSFQFNFKPNSRLAIADITQASDPIYCGGIETSSAFDLPTTTELLIISSPALQKEAEKLSNYKTTQRGISSSNITTKTIYQDFSAGKQDVMAIRNFIRYQYLKPGSKLKYVILLGDASVDYKGQNVVSTALEKSCFVPTYQSVESLQPLLSYASDDFYGIIGPKANTWEEDNNPQNAGILVAIGRIPAKNPQEANMFINKLMDYESKPRTKLPQLAWVADDGDGNIHMQDAEDFSNILLNAAFPSEQNKTYLDQFPMQQSNGAYTSPAATQAVIELFEHKAEFIHYTGHGSESGLADEKLLTTNDIIGLKNNTNLPILLTATCQFGRYDDPNILSGGEAILLSDQGGAIALISTTRPVFQSSNYLFGQAFYRSMVANRNNSNYRLGDLFRDTKNQSQSGVINRNIHLLGDPSMKLPWTFENIQVDIDSLKQELRVSGNIIANSTVTVQLHRTADKKSTLGNKSEPFTFRNMSPVVWKASGYSSSNRLSVNLKTLPTISNDNTYQLMIWSEKGAAMAMPLKAWTNKQTPDKIAPQISINLVNEMVNSSSANPNVLINLADSSGLAWQNNEGKIAYIVLDDKPIFELASITKLSNGNAQNGMANIQLKNLSNGIHKIQVFCWDVYNNYTQSTLEFQVSNDDSNSLMGLIYPNPLNRTFNFVFEQMKPWNRMPYELEVSNLLGQVVLKRTGISKYQDLQQGIISFEWTEDEWQRMNQMMIFRINVLDELQNDLKTYRIKTSTLK